MRRAHAAAALYVTAGVSLLLLFIGIHNAWDIAVWFTAERPNAERRGEGARALASRPRRER